MAANFPSDAQALRAEIAAAAARFIAEDGADYATAKRKASRQVLGDVRVRGDLLPDNAQIEEEVRQYQELFLGETQPARLRHLREMALQIMEELAEFQPFVTGAVLNGTAGEHSDIHLQLFTDNHKDVEMDLLNRNIDFDVSETPHFRRPNASVEVVSFFWKTEGVHLALYQTDDLRGSVKLSQGRSRERADVKALRALMDEA
ncbi:MAG: hypothetical protein ACTHL1_01505 [Burkholderiaceae bacterium]